MTAPTPLTLPERALTIAQMVAAEFETHRPHVRREFAAELADAFRKLKVPGDDPRDKAFSRAVELCASMAEQLADVPGTAAQARPRALAED
jgi:hypothetical protein